MSVDDETGKMAPHYDTGYQHWNLVLDTGMGYLEGNATKYVSRWRKKNGLEDLKKALHYVNKLLEWMGDEYPVDTRESTLDELEKLRDQVNRFADANGLDDLERQIVGLLARWSGKLHVVRARDLIVALMEHADRLAPAVPIEDSNRHGDRAASEVETGKSCRLGPECSTLVGAVCEDPLCDYSKERMGEIDGR